MADLEKLRANLEARGFRTTYFPTADEAAAYLDGQIDGKTVGIGGSMTVKEMGLYPRLAAHNQVVWHWEGGALRDAVLTDVYITSANALAETGEIVNIDGNGNRVSSTLYGHQKVYFLVGVNKVAPDFEAALWRARNVAAPLNARRLHRKTPCAQGEALRCYDCKSPERICNGLSVLWRPLGGAGETMVLLVDEDLGY